MRIQHILHAFILICTLVVALSVFYMMYLLSDGTLFGQPLDRTALTFQTTKDIYHPGDIVKATANFCKTRNIVSTYQWQIVDTYIRFYPAEQSSLPVGCYQDREITIEVVPIDTHPGIYYFTGQAQYRINPLVNVTVTLKSNKFTVEGSAPPGSML